MLFHCEDPIRVIRDVREESDLAPIPDVLRHRSERTLRAKTSHRTSSSTADRQPILECSLPPADYADRSALDRPKPLTAAALISILIICILIIRILIDV
jgi:hypothetical protein